MKFLGLLLMGLMGVLPVRGQDAAEMVRRVRLAATVMQTDLEGVVRREGGGKQPITLMLREQNMQFELGAAHRFHIRMGDEECRLFRIDPATGKTSEFPAADLSKEVPGTDLTYEDLTLRFLYWPGAKLEGEETVRDEKCWKIRLDNPKPGSGSFGAVYVWIHQKYGAFWDIKAYDRKGVPLKSFEVTKVMQLPDKNYTLEQMRIQKLKPNGRTESITYLEFNRPSGKKSGLRGPRR